MKARIALALVAAGASAAVIACVLADPPPIVTPPPPFPPVILTESVTPPLGELLHAPCGASDCFVVPVLADPDQSVQWRVFVDLDTKGSPTAQDAIIKEQSDGGVLGVTGEAGTGVRTFSFDIPESTVDMTRCHTFTFVVAYQFDPGDFSRPLVPPGGTSAIWRYEPVSNCTLFDAGGAD